jgi:hypothetical protein
MGIARMISQRVLPRTGEFGQAMRALMGDIKKLKPEQVFERFMQRTKEMPAMAAMMSTSLDDMIKRLRQLVGDTLRDIGMPTIKWITQKLGEWVKHLKEASETGKPLIQAYSEKLLKAVQTIADLSGKVFSHWKEIALIWGSSKVASFLSGMGGLAGIGSKLGGFGLGGIGAAAGQGFGAFLGALPGAAGTLAVFTVAVQTAADALVDFALEGKAKEATAEGFGPAFKALGEAAKAEEYMRKHSSRLTSEEVELTKERIRDQTRIAGKVFKSAGMLDPSGAGVSPAFEHVLKSAATDSLKTMATSIGQSALADQPGMLAAFASEFYRRHVVPTDVVAKTAEKPSEIHGKKPPVTNIGTLNLVQKFDEQDPDRIFVRFHDGLTDLVHRPMDGNHSFAHGM